MQIRHYCRVMTGAPTVVRDATEADLDATVELIAAHRGGDVDDWRRLFANALHDDKRHFVVALVDGRVIGFGHTKLVEREVSSHDEQTPPPGWYLSGVTVDPDYRRRGVGTALTRVRLDRLRGKTKIVYYAAEPDNLATLELHALLGFSPTGRLVNVPGAERPLTLHRLAM
jgi:ribosomal protein S18 acetylase RimI-like enzyme